MLGACPCSDHPSRQLACAERCGCDGLVLWLCRSLELQRVALVIHHRDTENV